MCGATRLGNTSLVEYGIRTEGIVTAEGYSGHHLIFRDAPASRSRPTARTISAALDRNSLPELKGVQFSWLLLPDEVRRMVKAETN